MGSSVPGDPYSVRYVAAASALGDSWGMEEVRRRGSSYTGTSGWAYKEWRGKFYPRGLRQVDELAYTAEHLATVEMNSPFYRLQTPRLYEQWRNQVPAAFPLAVKGWRGVTHFKKLRDAEGAIGQFFGCWLRAGSSHSRATG